MHHFRCDSGDWASRQQQPCIVGVAGRHTRREGTRQQILALCYRQWPTNSPFCHASISKEVRSSSSARAKRRICKFRSGYHAAQQRRCRLKLTCYCFIFHPCRPRRVAATSEATTAIPCLLDKHPFSDIQVHRNPFLQQRPYVDVNALLPEPKI